MVGHTKSEPLIRQFGALRIKIIFLATNLRIDEHLKGIRIGGAH